MEFMACGHRLACRFCQASGFGSPLPNLPLALPFDVLGWPGREIGSMYSEGHWDMTARAVTRI